MKRRRTLSSKASSWLFILPALTVVILLLLYPVTSSIFYSLTNKNLIKPTYRFLGLDNYIKTLTDPDFWTAFWNDLKWTFFSLLGQLIVGFTGALALNRIKKGSSIYRTILIIPWAIPSIVLAFSWKWILNGVYGFLPNLLIKLGLWLNRAGIFDWKSGVCNAGVHQYLVRLAADHGQHPVSAANRTKRSV